MSSPSATCSVSKSSTKPSSNKRTTRLFDPRGSATVPPVVGRPRPKTRNPGSSRPAAESPNGKNPTSIAPAVGGLFFPQSKSLGIDRSQYSLAIQAKIVYAGSNSTSFEQAEANLDKLAELQVGDKQVRRLCKQIGAERCEERDRATATYQALPLPERKAVPQGVTAPAVAVVGVDGGRLQIFDRPTDDSAANTTPPSSSPELAESFDEDEEPENNSRHWRESKIGLLMTMTSAVHDSDPCPEIPKNFVDPSRIVQLVRELKKPVPTAPDEAAPDPPTTPDPLADWEPPEVEAKRLVASRRPWEKFGPQVATAAWQWGFFEALRRAFLGDGAEVNWTVWRTLFSSFTPILDFIHALSYVFAAATAGRPFSDGWACYVRWIEAVWQGRVDDVLTELADRLSEFGETPADESTSSPRYLVQRARDYLSNNRERMKYAEYRRQGLPIVSSYVESAVKQFNYRVKGTEKFWNEEGAEEILQLRADLLSDDEPLEAFWKRRESGETGQRRYRRAA